MEFEYAMLFSKESLDSRSGMVKAAADVHPTLRCTSQMKHVRVRMICRYSREQAGKLALRLFLSRDILGMATSS